MTPICRDTRLCHFCSYNAVKNEAHCVLECPPYNPIRDYFPSLVPRSLKFFFQLNQQDNISLYLTEAATLRHSRNLTGLKPSSYTFSPISFFGFLDFSINFISFIAMSNTRKLL